MKKTAKRTSFGLTSLFVLLAPAMMGCASNGQETLILKALNCEDYIGEDAFEFTYINDAGEEVTASYDDVLSGFEQYESEKLGKPVKVIYDTYDTNETMLASLKTGKTTYDLIAASDYTVQKMMSMGMLQKIHRERVPNYNEYCSRFLLDKMESITAPIDGVEEKMADYSVGYMWGTLGILFNPEKVANDKGLDPEEVKFDMQFWPSLWEDKYRGIMSVKDSMRDTYSVGIMRHYEEDIRKAMEASGCFDMTVVSLDLDSALYEEALNGEYAATLNEIFNRCDKEAVEAIKGDLLELKEKVFGFEVDSGKDDIVKGLVGMNLAWSGDAVYSLDRGDNEANQTLYYSIPVTGGNIWFDSWCIPATSDEEHRSAAEDFLDFISDPQVAAANMSTIGYTSFIAGDTVHDLIRSWFDPRAYAMYVYHDASGDPGCTWEDSDFIYFDEEDDTLDPNDFSDSGMLYMDGTGIDEETGDDHGCYDMRGSTYEQAVVDGVAMTWEEYQEKYNAEMAETEDDELAWDIRDLTYVFSGTIEVEDVLGDTPETNPYLFYTDELEAIEGETADGQVGTVTIGRQFYAQYPDQTLIPKLAVMKDYGENNRYVLEMWSDIKSNNLPLAGVIVFGIILAGAAVIIIGLIVSKRRFHAVKVKRRKAQARH